MSYNPFEELKADLDEIKSMLANNPTAERPGVVEKPITTAELSEFLGITEPSIIRLKKQGKLPFLQIGGSIRFDKAAVIKAFEKNAAK